MSTSVYNRYILNTQNAAKAIEQGLAEADWYTSPIPKAELRRLLERRDGPAIRDTAIWLVPVSYTHLTLPTNREV